MSEPPPREEAIFSEALGLPHAERDAFLRRACGADVVLHQLVTELLRAHDSAGASRFMDSPAAVDNNHAAENTRAHEPVPGDRIGRYKLLEQIGEGGWGVVWMAEQEEPVRRRVAVKIIKIGMDTKAVIARFEAERQALALMDHPAIAKVFDGGTTAAGRPYFVMELVRGIPITSYCDENKLPPDARMRLFIQVCQAVQHAHQKGIIHRDLKPSNILVTLRDGVPLPKVIDFGIAKATQGRLTDKTLFTQLHSFIGTPAYSSPEQMEPRGLDVDTRSDIYSLGVLFYELLAGRPPFDTRMLENAGLEEMRRTIREVDPPRPSSRLSTLTREDRATVARQRAVDPMKLSVLLRGDLDSIVMHCLEKNRTRRYETANGLAMDIQRHLNHEPIVARPPSAAYRFGKMIRRNPRASVAIVAMAVVLAAGAATSTWQAVRARRAERLAEERLEIERVVRRETEQQRTLALEAERTAETEAAHSAQVARAMKDMLAEVDSLVALGRDTKVLREIFDLAARRLASGFAGQPEAEADLRDTLGSGYLNLGQYDEAAAMYREALALRRQVNGEQHPLVARALNNLGTVLGQQAKWEEARHVLGLALDMQKQLLGAEHPDVALSLANLGVVLAGQGDFQAGVQRLREAVAMQKRLLGDGHLEVAISLKKLGSVYEQNGRLSDAEECLTEAVAIYRKWLGDEHPTVASALNLLSIAIAGQGNYSRAIDSYLETLTIRQKLRNPSVRPSRENPLSMLQETGSREEAEAALRQMIRYMSEHYGARSWQTGYFIGMSVFTLLYEGKFEEAEPLARQCLEIREQIRPDDWLTYHARCMLGGVLAGLERFEEAEPLLLDGYEGITQRQANIPPDFVILIENTLRMIVKLYTDWEKPEQAEAWRKKLVEMQGAAPETLQP